MATEETLLSRASAYEGWSKVCGALVVIGILIEALIALEFQEHKDWRENWFPVFADLLVAGGVFGEIFFAGKRSKTEEHLRVKSNERVAAANERAAKAELATEKLRAQFAWRRLSPEQAEAMAVVLKHQKPFRLMFMHQTNDPESVTFANEIGSVFALHGWDVGYTACSYPGKPQYGIRAHLDPRPEIRDASIVVQTALESARILFTDLPSPPAAMSQGAGHGPDYPWAEIYIGPKGMPFIE